METVQGYREANAWMQPGGNTSLPKACVQAPAQAHFARQECHDGLVRLYGPHAVDADASFAIALSVEASLPVEGYRVQGTDDGIAVAGGSRRGLLYGVYALLMQLRLGTPLKELSLESAPRAAHRVINHWDNINGRVERGYSGRSLFFENGDFRYDPARVTAYARLMASIGINEICINNVNVSERSAELITPVLLPKLAEVAALFRPFGIRLVIAVHFESPVLLGGLKTADPLEDAVAVWWRDTVKAVYQAIPDVAGFLVKADSEFRGGPAALGRTQADGANVIARALAPFDGILYWRCFVYDCQQDWRDKKTDRPMAAFEHFFPLDGAFDPNVILQIKNGPSDFQVREPNSPLLGAMRHTREAIELQITQEYTGQQIDLYALAVQWQEVLDAPVDEYRVTRDLIGQEIEAFTAVSNVGRDENWTGHTLAQANLYAYGRLAWDPSLTAEAILRNWIALTFGGSPALMAPLLSMMLASRHTYEKYNAPLGIGWMVNVGYHYGPSVDGYEYMKWGTYHRADHQAIGVDRTAQGTGFARQYDPWVAARYESLETCPEALLLFFHRLRYDHMLKNGKTLLQYIYDSHFEGVEEVEGFLKTWDAITPLLPETTAVSVRDRLLLQLENAREWRDVINTYFYRKTGIPDAQGRHIYA